MATSFEGLREVLGEIFEEIKGDKTVTCFIAFTVDEEGTFMASGRASAIAEVMTHAMTSIDGFADAVLAAVEKRCHGVGFLGKPVNTKPI